MKVFLIACGLALVGGNAALLGTYIVQDNLPLALLYLAVTAAWSFFTAVQIKGLTAAYCRPK